MRSTSISAVEESRRWAISATIAFPSHASAWLQAAPVSKIPITKDFMAVLPLLCLTIQGVFGLDGYQTDVVGIERVAI
jgi:hypothetical protein